MAVKLTVTPSTKYIEDPINIKITGATASQLANAELHVMVYNKDIYSGAYGGVAFVKEKNLSNNFNIVCPPIIEQSPRGITYGLPQVYSQDFLQNTDKLNYVYFDIYVNDTSIIDDFVKKTLYIKPEPPTFDVEPQYVDSNNSAITLTNNNKILVNNLSTPTISNVQGTAYKDGFIKYVKIGNFSYNYASGVYSIGPINFPSLELSITLIDSRGWESEKKILADASKFKYKYNAPNITSCEIERDGISETVNLKASGYYLEGYQAGQNPISGEYKWKESSASSYTNNGNLTLIKTPTTTWTDFNDIIYEYEHPHWYAAEDNIEYYTGTQWNNGISALFNAAISYNNKYTQEYLQADYDSVNDRYRVISGGYNGSWEAFWFDTIKAIYDVMYGEDGYGGNYEWRVAEIPIEGDIETGFSIDKSFYVACLIAYDNLAGNSIKEIYIDTALPAIDIYNNKIALHDLYDENLDGDIQLNGEVMINGKGLFEQKILWSGAHWPADYHTLDLSEKVSEQKHGIVLVWSAYEDDSSQDYDFNYKFVPKEHIDLFEGYGVVSILGNVLGTKFGIKYVYVYDNRIIGNANNKNTINNTPVGINITNNKFVLRYVIGI